MLCLYFCFVFKQKTAYEMRISDWSSDVCSSDLRGLAISPATPILQGSASWMSPGGWSMGLAGGVELRSPGQPVVVLGRVSRFWSLSDDWLAHASLLYYDYRAERYRGIPDRADANLYFTYRDTLSVGVSAMRPSGDQARGLLGAADRDVSYPRAARKNAG